KPVIYDIHESYADFILLKEYLPAWFRKPLSRLIGLAEPQMARLSQGLIFADDEIGNSFSALTCPKTTLFNFPGAAVIEEGQQASNKRLSGNPVVLHLGSHESGRGPFLMLKAFREVVYVVPEARLLLVGPFYPPALENVMRQVIAEFGLEAAVTITGQVTFEKVGIHLRHAAIGWVPLEPVAKYNKNIPTKMFEYMAYGLPQVCSDLPSTRPFIESGPSGLLVTPDDPKSHAEAIIQLLQNPESATAMGKRGQSMVASHYNWAQMEPRLLKLYAEVMAN
ncbi:MAG TPA: glycosyltransferase, partial [candidate division Zixibacteria bacterium]|nr:glycosyltransferase [candidate division Zixibacteria bacterium]